MSYEEDEELKELLEKKRAEIEAAVKAQREAAKKEAELRERLEREYILRTILSEEARERLERIRLARPNFAKALEDQLILLAKTGRIRGVISDDQLKKILLELSKRSESRGGEIRIRRKSI